VKEGHTVKPGMALKIALPKIWPLIKNIVFE
jgi:hypothetical protein